MGLNLIRVQPPQMLRVSFYVPNFKCGSFSSYANLYQIGEDNAFSQKLNDYPLSFVPQSSFPSPSSKLSAVIKMQADG